MAYVPEITTLADVPRVHGRRRPDATALWFEGRGTTYAVWSKGTMRVANALLADRLQPGARIAVLDRNTDVYFEVLFGAALVGAVTVTLNWRLAPPELAYILNDAGAEVLFVGEKYFRVVDAIRAELTSVRRIVALSGGRPDWPSYADWRDRQPADDPAVAVAPDSPVVQMYTSGTTGHPKGVQLSHASFFAHDRYRAEHTSETGDDPGGCATDRSVGAIRRLRPIHRSELAWNDWGPADVSLVTMPTFHVSGAAWGIVGLYNGAKNVVLEQFDVGGVLEAIQRHRVTKLVLVPAAIHQVLRHPRCRETDFSSIEYLLYGASPIPLDLLDEAVKTFACGFVQLYGLTETCGAVTYLPAKDHERGGNRRMRSAGRALPGVEIAIRDENGADLPRGEVGEICIHTRSVMIGYWNRPEDTAKTIGPDGWLRSGDAGYLDEDGYLYIHDRVKDMIVSGGENVYPAEVENAIFGHPDVADVAVIGVPDDKWGEAVKAIVVPRAGVTPDASDILAFARSRIAGYKVPKSVDLVAELPRNASGKVLKRELREPYWKGRERRVN